MSYEKSKRKNEDVPPLFLRLLQGLWHYCVVLPVQGTWWLTKQTVRGSWWLVKNGSKAAWDATVWSVKAPIRLLTWIWYAIMGLPPEFETQRETNIYRMIRRRYRRRNFFALHSLFYGLGMFTGLVAIISIYRNSAVPGFDPYQGVSSTIAFIVAWTMVWAFHLIQKRSGDSEDRELQGALEQEYERQQRAEKRAAYDDYYQERLAINDAEGYEPSGNHTAAYYDDDSHSRTERKR